MIRYFQRYFASIPAVFIDGSIYVLLAFIGANGAALSSDMAAKYMDAELIFYLQWINNASGASLLALKMFRSTGFAQHQEEKKKKDDDTKIFTKE